MEPLQAIALGIIQGLTEFLPVSSSGHLVLLQKLFGLTEPELLFDICVHTGTLAAVCIVFFQEIRSIFSTLLHLPDLTKTHGSYKALLSENQDARMALLILVGSIPTAVLGVLFHKIADKLFSTIWLVGIMLLVTGTLLWFTQRAPGKNKSIKKVALKDALVIGLVQGLAILPGISRSGATISAALFLGVDREVAGRFSFLLSIPAILGALIIGLDSSVLGTPVSWKTILAGTVSAGVVGFGALKLLLHMVRKGRLYSFAPYCWFLGVAALLWNALLLL